MKVSCAISLLFFIVEKECYFSNLSMHLYQTQKNQTLEQISIFLQQKMFSSILWHFASVEVDNKCKKKKTTK